MSEPRTSLWTFLRHPGLRYWRFRVRRRKIPAQSPILVTVGLTQWFYFTNTGFTGEQRFYLEIGPKRRTWRFGGIRNKAEFERQMRYAAAEDAHDFEQMIEIQEERHGV